MTYNKSRCKKSVTDLYAFLAQLDRASGYGPEGRGFESSRTHNSEMCRNSNTNFDTFFFDFLWILKIQSTIIEKVVQFFKKENVKHVGYIDHRVHPIVIFVIIVFKILIIIVFILVTALEKEITNIFIYFFYLAH